TLKKGYAVRDRLNRQSNWDKHYGLYGGPSTVPQHWLLIVQPAGGAIDRNLCKVYGATVKAVQLRQSCRYLSIQPPSTRSSPGRATGAVTSYDAALWSPPTPYRGEHRAVMEAAFVYGTSYQFALTTEIALLENIGINCADWSDVCTKENVTAFPVVKLYKEGESPVSYAGMLGTKDLLKFIQINRISCPVNIASIQEAEKYLRGELYKDLFGFTSVSVLGLFSPAMTSAKEHFREAGKQLRGSVITGVYSEDDVWILSNKYAATLPAMLLARPREGRIESIPLATIPVQDMVQILANAPLEAFPEITVENLPAYVRLQRPLLILFSDGSISPQYRNTALALVRQKRMDSFTPCWLNLKNTPVGRGILKAYFGPLPPLPQLLLVNLHAGGQVYAFPSAQSITEQNLILWLEKLEAGLEKPITILSAQEWKPPLPAFDFLSMMDAPTSQAPTKKVLECTNEAEVQESAEQPQG
ncbi:hypothetical protein A6R68_17339, partial [Neotoma lepida]